MAREYLFCAHTPEPIVKSCAARIEPESALAGLDQLIRFPDTRPVTAPLLVLGATDDGSRADGEVSAAALTYRTDAELFRNKARADGAWGVSCPLSVGLGIPMAS